MSTRTVEELTCDGCQANTTILRKPPPMGLRMPSWYHVVEPGTDQPGKEKDFCSPACLVAHYSK